MPTPFESATLNLRLFELRREEVLREARSWYFAEFNPETFAEFAAIVSGPRNASFRMVLGYWDMAASLVSTFAKIRPFLADLRAASDEPEFSRHLEAVMMAMPDAEATMARRREAISAANKARRDDVREY